jgi:hypothetical protein
VSGFTKFFLRNMKRISRAGRTIRGIPYER